MKELARTASRGLFRQSDLVVPLSILLVEFVVFGSGFLAIGFRAARHVDSFWVSLVASVGLFVLLLALVSFEFVRATGLHSLLRGAGSAASVFPLLHERNPLIPVSAPKTSEAAMREDWEKVRSDLMQVLKEKGLSGDE